MAEYHFPYTAIKQQCYAGLVVMLAYEVKLVLEELKRRRKFMVFFSSWAYLTSKTVQIPCYNPKE